METIYTTPAQTKDTIKFPCAMEHKETGLVVLFHKESAGVTLHVGGYAETEFGEYFNSWIMTDFHPVQEGSSLTIRF